MVATGNRDDLADVYKRFYWTVPGRPYYSFHWGWLVGIVLAVGGQESYDVDSAQFKWLKTELESAKELKAKGIVTWIVVWAHTPIYSSSDGHKGGNADMRPALEPLLVKYGVHLIIAGDDHVYERSFPRFADDVQMPLPTDVLGADSLINDPKFPVHFTVGTGGIDLDGWIPGPRPMWSAHRELSHGYLKVVAFQHQLTTSFVRSDGKEVDIVHIRDSVLAEAFRLHNQRGKGRGIGIWIVPVIIVIALLLWNRRALLPAVIARSSSVQRLV